ncbi:MAG: DNA repair protein RecN [Bacillota bacterium]|jgi:DNA repair protein RecN (Recombination protein N)|nr:DNA repair protein RecN [Bacillota bacterium]
MLLELDVRNYALIDSLSIPFGPGFNVLTGETGAGKSLIIDCLGLVIGGRASADSVRSGSDSALVEAVFDISDVPEAARIVAGLGIELEPDGTLVLSRQVWSHGRSQCRVNGRMVTATALAQLGSALVDIYGQHDYQSLTRPARHMALLDSFGGQDHLEAVERYHARYREWLQVRGELSELRAKARDRAQRIDILSYQVDEISKAALSPDEESSLLRERQIIANAERLHEAAERAYSALYECSDVQGRSAYDLAASALAELEAAARIDPALAETCAIVSQVCDEMARVATALRSYRDSTDYDPGRLAAVEDRLSLIARLKRKYGDTVADVLEHLETARRQLELLSGADERGLVLERAEAELAAELLAQARRLTERRREIADRLGKAVCRELEGLNMPQARFLVAMGPVESDNIASSDGAEVALGASGADDVEFMFSANVGEEPRPLVRIASGGELSRVMLAIKSVLALADEMPTMVFDEVDQGIGGEAAQAVAQRLRDIGRVRQVLAVTHLPQIAASAQRHLGVYKEVKDGRTAVAVRPLEGHERVGEIARMLAGERPSQVTLEHAREMLGDGQEIPR